MDFDSLLRLSKEFSLIWFFLVFVGIVIWAYWPANKKEFDDTAKRMLEDDPIHQKSTKATEEPNK